MRHVKQMISMVISMADGVAQDGPRELIKMAGGIIQDGPRKLTDGCPEWAVV